MKIRDMILFCDLVRFKSKKTVAQKHNLTIQNVTYAVACLEKCIGDKIFAEKKEKYILTEAGMLLYDFAAKQLKLYYDIFRPSDTIEMTVKIGLMKSLEEIFMPNLLVESFRDESKYKFALSRLNEFDVNSLAKQITERELDIAIFWQISSKKSIKGPSQDIDDNILKKTLFIALPYIWTSKDSEIARLTVANKANIQGQKFINNSGGNDKMADEFISFLDEKQIVFKSDQKHLIAKMVAENIANYIDFMLPGGNLIQQQVFSNENLTAVKLDCGSNLECITMYRHEPHLEKIVQSLSV